MAKHTRTPLMAGNWKANLNHHEAVVLVQKLAWTLGDKKHDFGKVEVVVLPPYTDLRSVQTLVDGDRLKIGYGAQDVSIHDEGAYTGEITTGMLTKLGCTYVVVGHSERREYHREDDALVNAKAHKTVAAGHDPDRLRRRGARDPAGRGAGRLHADPDRGIAGGLLRRAGRRPGDRLRAGLGDRHGRGGDARRTPRRCARPSGHGWRSCTATRSARPCGSCTAGR